MVHAATIALIHAHHVHARGQTVPRDSQHVLRFARSLQPVHHDQRQRSPVLLPVTVAQQRNAGFHFDQTLLSSRWVDSARQKEGSESLHVPAAQPATRPEDGGRERRRLLRQAVFELSS